MAVYVLPSHTLASDLLGRCNSKRQELVKIMRERCGVDDAGLSEIRSTLGCKAVWETGTRMCR
jgi:hypothetical protein